MGFVTIGTFGPGLAGGPTAFLVTFPKARATLLLSAALIAFFVRTAARAFGLLPMFGPYTMSSSPSCK